MPHHAMIGTTGSGKTSLARMLQRRERAKGVLIVVLDPFFNDWPHADVVFRRWEDMRRKLPAMARTRKRFGVYVDEPAQCLPFGDPMADFLATGARQAGWVSHFMAQRDRKMLSPAIRSSVHFWWIMANEDGRELARRFHCPAIERLPHQPRGTVILCRNFEAPLTGQINFGENPTVDLKPLAPVSDHRLVRQ